MSHRQIFHLDKTPWPFALHCNYTTTEILGYYEAYDNVSKNGTIKTLDNATPTSIVKINKDDKKYQFGNFLF